MRSDRPILSIIGIVLTLAVGPTQAERISIACSALGVELQLCREGADAWARETGHQVTLVSTPNSATERLALYQQLLATGAPDIDVLQIDAIWPGLLSQHLIDLRPYANGAEQQHFLVNVQNNTVNGRLVAMPWYIDAGLLYYRQDLLEKYGEPVPDTWEALTTTARKIQEAERAAGNSRLWGFVWQARAYEGLTCNALEWIASHRGGTLIDAQGKITIDNSRAVTALTLAASWITTISPKGVLNYGEEEARGVFQSGNAVFMRNWPYAWALAQSEGSPVKGKVGLAALPKGGADGRQAAALGGWQLAVSKYSRHPELAAALVMYLTSPAEQKRRALRGAYNPTLPSLYRDPDILQANPFIDTLYETFVNAVTRPSAVAGPRYNQISFEFWSAVYAVLTGKTSAQHSLARLEQTLQRISHGGHW